MELRIGFDATSAVHQSAGIGRYTRELLEALARIPGDEEYRVHFCNWGPHFGRLPQLPTRFRVHPVPASDRVMNIAWHRARLPLPVQVLTGSFDVYHSPDFTLPPTWRRPTVLTVHDLAFLTVPDCAFPTLRAYLERVVPRSVRRATRVIAVSEHTRRDVIDLLNIPAERVITVHEGVGNGFVAADDPLTLQPLLRELGVERPYILAVGTLEPRKNYVRLFEAYHKLRDQGVEAKLVIAGKPGWLYEPILARVEELNIERSVSLVHPTDEQLRALYAQAEVFVYPSLYEGFGLPPLEALACGAAVACSASSSLPEILGDAALTFDPRDVDAIAHNVSRLLTDVPLRRSLQARGPAQAATFTWERTARETLAVYHEAAHD